MLKHFHFFYPYAKPQTPDANTLPLAFYSRRSASTGCSRLALHAG